jgi:hypothetical protein
MWLLNGAPNQKTRQPREVEGESQPWLPYLTRLAPPLEVEVADHRLSRDDLRNQGVGLWRRPLLVHGVSRNYAGAAGHVLDGSLETSEDIGSKELHCGISV